MNRVAAIVLAPHYIHVQITKTGEHLELDSANKLQETSNAA